jgi:hypothetical protein
VDSILLFRMCLNNKLKVCTHYKIFILCDSHPGFARHLSNQKYANLWNPQSVAAPGRPKFSAAKQIKPGHLSA